MKKIYIAWLSLLIYTAIVVTLGFRHGWTLFYKLSLVGVIVLAIFQLSIPLIPGQILRRLKKMTPKEREKFLARFGLEIPVRSMLYQLHPDMPFEWPAGMTLEAIVPTVVTLPGSIFDSDDEVFDSVIQISDANAKIRFEPSGTSSRPVFKTISVRLEPGMHLKLTKASTAWFSSETVKPGDEFYMRNVSQQQ